MKKDEIEYIWANNTGVRSEHVLNEDRDEIIGSVQAINGISGTIMSKMSVIVDLAVPLHVHLLKVKVIIL